MEGPPWYIRYYITEENISVSCCFQNENVCTAPGFHWRHRLGPGAAATIGLLMYLMSSKCSDHKSLSRLTFNLQERFRTSCGKDNVTFEGFGDDVSFVGNENFNKVATQDPSRWARRRSRRRCTRHCTWHCNRRCTLAVGNRQTQQRSNWLYVHGGSVFTKKLEPESTMAQGVAFTAAS